VPKMYRSGDLAQNIEVESGDTIFVQRAPVFYIYGEVQRAGAFRTSRRASGRYLEDANPGTAWRQIAAQETLA